jgi:hypothetical protein
MKGGSTSKRTPPHRQLPQTFFFMTGRAEDSFRRDFLRGGMRIRKSNRRENALSILVRLPAGEDREAGVFLDSLEEIIDLNVGVTIVAIMHLGAFAKEGIGFVEKEDCTTSFRRIEDASQILLRLANIYRDDGAQIDALEIFSQIAGHSLRGDELTDPVFAGE